MKKKQRLGLLIRLALSAVLIVLLFSLIDREHFVQHLRNMNLTYFVIGLGFYFLGIGFWALRWYIFIHATEKDVSFWSVLRVTIIGIFFSMFLPTMVGTDLGRMYEMSRDRENKIGVVSTVLLDRLMGLATLILMALVTLFIGNEYTADVPIREIVIGITALMAVSWLVFFNRDLMRHFVWVFELPVAKQLEPTIRSIYDSLAHLQSQPRLLLSAVIISLLNQLSEVMAVVMIAQALKIQIAPIYFFIFMPLVWLILMIPVSISGLGLREGVFAFFFTQVGATGAESLAMSLLFYSHSVVVGLIGGIFLLKSFVTSSSSLIPSFRKPLDAPHAKSQVE